MNRRPVASLALCAILGTVFTGCAGRDGAVINADDPWYDLKEIIYTAKDLTSDSRTITGSDIWLAGDDLFFYTRQYDADGDIACVSLLDPSGEESPRELFEFRGREILDMRENGDGTFDFLSCDSVLSIYDELNLHRITYDPTDGSVTEEDVSNDMYSDRAYFLGDGLMGFVKTDTSDAIYSDEYGNFDLEAITGYYSIPVSTGIVAVSEREVLLEVYLPSGNFDYYLIDLESKEYMLLDESSGISGNPATMGSFDGEWYVSGTSEIYRYDPDAKAFETVIELDRSYCHRFLANKATLAGVYYGKVILYADTDSKDWNGSYTPETEYHFMSFTEADENPHAGKKILTIASVTEPDYYLSRVMKDFNDMSTEAFIVYDEEYLSSAYGAVGDTDELLNLKIAEEERIRMKFLNGEAPDIIFNTSEMEALNNDSCLLDLTGFYEADSELQQDVFGSVLEAGKTDGKMYSIPLNICITGIRVPSDLTDGVGMTFEEYAAFKSEECNGEDPMDSYIVGINEEYSRELAMLTVFDAMRDCFASEGNVVIDPLVYEDYVAFCRDLPANAVELDYNDPEAFISYKEQLAMRPGLWCEMDSFEDYVLAVQSLGPVKVIGFPSPDGRGPVNKPDLSVGICSSTENPDLCWEFVRMLLQKDYQDLVSCRNMIPINVESFEERAAVDIANANKYTSIGVPEVSSDAVQDFEDVIGSVSGAVRSDPAIDIIFMEETQPLLITQKSLDEVIGLIEDRVQTLLDEKD